VTIDLRISGISELAQVTRALKGAPKDIRREMHKALQQSTRPLIEAARDGARRDLPSRGGLADYVAGATIRPSLTGLGSDSPRLRLKATRAGAAAAAFGKARSADKRRNRRRLRG